MKFVVVKQILQFFTQVRLLDGDQIVVLTELPEVSGPVGLLSLVDVPVEQRDAGGIKGGELVMPAIIAVYQGDDVALPPLAPVR